MLTDLMDTQSKSSSLKRSRDDVVAKLSLIKASLFALEQVYSIYFSTVMMSLMCHFDSLKTL